ncbi:GRIM-19 [Ochromonadaceae sp. CCMP2298]|nr:GRIM-19 [Ochromonadaceae sp. CCMP2298]|mmetsp:Transcript_19443/g.43328  ORF Transcript_19443/g.43328 Transcript_19443/m.43328 type:complete len:126 (-) Transcript_19443:73-450(-)
MFRSFVNFLAVNPPNTKSYQDVPPPGGFPGIPTTRDVRPRGPPGWFIWMAVFSASAYGFYQIGRSGYQNRLNKKEKREARMATLSFLQAEKDREMAERLNVSLAEEKEVMKGDKNWVVGASVYSK